MSSPTENMLTTVDAFHRHRTVVETAEPSVLRIGSDAGWFERAGDTRVSLETRAVLRRLLLVLVAEHPRRTPLSSRALSEAVWPGETLLPQSRANRLAVALSTLRTLGLRGLIVRARDGWFLAHNCRVIVESSREGHGPMRRPDDSYEGGNAREQ